MLRNSPFAPLRTRQQYLSEAQQILDKFGIAIRDILTPPQKDRFLKLRKSGDLFPVGMRLLESDQPVLYFGGKKCQGGGDEIEEEVTKEDGKTVVRIGPMDHAIALAIVLLPLATFALAICQGQSRMPGWSLQDCTRVALFWAGVFGLVLYFASSVLWLLGDRAPRFTDSIDWGPWTGVSTLLVLLMYLHTFAVLAGLVGFNAYRCVTRTARSA